MTMFTENSRRMIAAFSAAIIIGISCVAQGAAPAPKRAQSAGASSTLRGSAATDLSARLPQLNTVAVSMICATSGTGPKSVILKWVIDNSWLPEQGFDLYRKGPGESNFSKIAGPIRENPNMAPVALSTINGVAKTVNIAALQKQARAVVQIPPEMMRAFAPAPSNIETSGPVFEELKQLRTKQFTPITAATRADFSITKPGAYTKLDGYFQRFKIQRTLPLDIKPNATQTPAARNLKTPSRVVKTTAQKSAPAVKSPVQMTVEARRALLMGALVNKTVCEALGLGYVDTGVVEGQTYEYQLRRTAGTGDAPVASCTITVGADPLPAKPDELSACQLDLNNVALRWKLDASKTSARVISYNIYRTQNGKRQLVNAQPHMVGPVEDGNGNYADPIYYFTDKDVPVGDIDYELIGSDAFGRQAAPVKLHFTMQDWETPLPVKQIDCAVNKGQVYIYWQPSLGSVLEKTGNGPATAFPKQLPGGSAMYNIYRYDQEGSKTWTRLNTEPIKPAFIPLPTFGRQYEAKLKAMSRSSNLSFIDKTCTKDAYYQYTVVAVYKKNRIEAAPSPPQTVGVPDLDPPAPVGSLTGKHEALVSQTSQFSFDARWAKAYSRPAVKVAKVKNLSYDPDLAKTKSGPQQKASSVQAAATRATADGARAKARTDLIKATISNSDLGGKATLTWEASALKAPVRYKVFRSSGTGFRVTSGFDRLAGGPGTARAVTRTAGKTLPAEQTEKRPTASYQYMGAKPADVRVMSSGKQRNLPAIQNKGVSLEFIKKVDISAIVPDSYQFLGEATSPKYLDFLPKSRPMYYNYRVVPINRWGIEGKPAVIQVRVGATVQPPTPELVSTYPNSEGGVTLTLKPLENKEECAKYLVYRKPLDLSSVIKSSRSTTARTTQTSVLAPSAAVAVQKRSGPIKFSSDMKISPMSAVVSSATASKARDRGLRTRVTLPMSEAGFAKDLRKILANQDYQMVGEIGADTIDKNGYVRYNDMKNLIPNQLYAYTAIAVDADSWRSAASEPETASPWKVTVAPVSNLKGTSSGNGITLSWTAPAGEILGYVVLKGIAMNTQFVQISDTIKPTTFTDFSVIKGKTYTYRVQAVDPLGNLSESISVDCMLSK